MPNTSAMREHPADDLETSSSPASINDGPEDKEIPNFAEHYSFFHEAVFGFVICAAQLMTHADLAMSIAPLKIISGSFNSTPKDLTWASAAYSLTVGTFIFVSGRLGDVYKHRLLFIVGFSWFGLWSLLAGFSVWSNPRFFDCCRAFQGIGPALLLPNGVAILGRSYPPGRRKGMVFSLFGAVAPGGFVLGATFSSLLAEKVWWPWGFWILGIACFMFAGLGFLAIPFVPHDMPRKDLSTFQQLDGFGALLGVSGLILINFAWNQAPIVGWQLPYTYVLLIVGILIMGLFLYLEGKAAYPLLPRSIFKGETGWVLGCIAAGWSSFGVLVFYYYQILENIEGNSGLLVTAKFANASLSGVCAAVTTGLLLGRVPASIIMFIAIWLSLLDKPCWHPCRLVLGECICDHVGHAMGNKDQGAAASLVNTVVNYSISMGLGIAGTVEQSVSNDGQDVLKGYRGATYTGVGLAGFGTILAICFMVATWMEPRKTRKL